MLAETCLFNRLSLDLTADVYSQNLIDSRHSTYTIVLHVGLHFVKLHVDKIPIPETLQHVERSSFFAVEKTQPDEIAIEKVRERPEPAGKARVNILFDPALDARLLTAA